MPTARGQQTLTIGFWTSGKRVSSHVSGSIVRFRTIGVLRTTGGAGVGSALSHQLGHDGQVSDFVMTPANRMLRRLLAMPPSMIERIAGPPAHVDGRTVAPSVHLLLRSLERVDVTGSSRDVIERRNQMGRSTSLAMPTVRGVRAVDRLIPGPDGQIPVRVYRSHRTVGRVPAIVYYHGGGWVVGDLDSHDGSCRMLAKHSGCVVVSVDYRRAPEAAFPLPLQDCLAAFRHVHDNPQQYSVTPGAVAVMGDSAGANLAAAVCLVSRDEGPVPIAQSLVYPATDLRMTATSIDTFATGFMLSKEDMLWYRNHYVPDPHTVLDPRVSPLLAEDLSGLPPAAVWTAGFDPLRDEGMAYAERLLEAGNYAEHTCFDDQIHGFFGMGVLPGGIDRIETVCRQTGDLVHAAQHDPHGLRDRRPPVRANLYAR